ncbi:MAG: hypothetical protein HKN25_12470 [Pyrinomonadaceae bacterium]|nr:hypothetical protein [Pyrinomonadaceae bacterium]
MISNLPIYLVLIVVLAFGAGNMAAQNDPTESTLQTIPPVPIEYEASPAYPFGRLNPNAPIETKQLEFLIGEFDCEDKIFSPRNKKWFRMDTVRKAEYVLNGYAIQDKNWTSLSSTSNIRAFDPKTKQWHITYFRTLPYSSAVWKGGKEGENMVFQLEKEKTTSRLTFFDIGQDGYSWKAENVTGGKAVMNWIFKCERRR